MNVFDQTTLRADNDPKFYSRFKWLGLAAFAFMLYCLYDGYINYPDQQVRGVALYELAKEQYSEERMLELHEGAHGDKEVYTKIVEELGDDEELNAAWTALAEENGWAAEPPEKLRADGDIAVQYVMAALVAVAAVWMWVTVWLASGRWIELAGETINTSWGQSFPVASVTKIDKRQWRDKGIARLRYEHDGGRGKFVVDNYKYDRKVTDEILRHIEAIAGVDKITGGPPEAVDADAQEPETAPPAEAAAMNGDAAV